MQHRLIVKLFDSKLSILSISLKEGDRVLECGAGTGEAIPILTS
jgi:ubiquinone/menaquinone biosynthesis C-methylase UbiE